MTTTVINSDEEESRKKLVSSMRKNLTRETEKLKWIFTIFLVRPFIDI